MRKLFISIFCAVATIYAQDQQTEEATPPWIPQSWKDASFPLEPKIKKLEFFADVLFWCPQETCTGWGFLVNPDFVVPLPPTVRGNFDTFLVALNFDWNWGVRAGLGYNMKHDAWDTRLLYTWFHSQGKDHRIAPPGFIIQSQFLASDELLHVPIYEEAKIRWNLLFNMFDWDLGRNCSLSRSLLFRHYLGIKGGWIHQNIYALWLNSDFQSKQILKHDFWGVGPKGGIYTRWNLARKRFSLFSLFGDFAGAFMWGHWDLCKEALSDTRNILVSNIYPARNFGALMFQGFTGLELNRLRFSLQLGYEMQIWLDHLQFFQHFSGILRNALILQGGTFRFQFMF